MNERIQLLKHQASLWCDENIPEQFSEETNGYGRAWEDKFAELIVRECVSLFDGTGEMKTAGMLTHNQVVGQIKKHFGVKE